MARYYRRYLRYRRFRRALRRYRRLRRRGRRFVNSSSKSVVRIRVPVSYTATMSVLPSSNAAHGTVLHGRIMPFHSNNTASQGAAVVSPLYREYCNLYDQVKCIGGKMTISIGTTIGSAAIPSLTVLTAWDRRVSVPNSNTDIAFDDMVNYGTVQRAVGVNNSIGKLSRSIYASDLIEKVQWHDCALDGAYDPPSDMAFGRASDNVNFFSPGLILAMSHTGSSTQTVTYLVDIVWYFAFRGAKYGGSAHDAKRVPVDAMDAPDGDMDNGGAAVALRQAAAEVDQRGPIQRRVEEALDAIRLSEHPPGMRGIQDIINERRGSVALLDNPPGLSSQPVSMKKVYQILRDAGAEHEEL